MAHIGAAILSPHFESSNEISTEASVLKSRARFAEGWLTGVQERAQFLAELNVDLPAPGFDDAPLPELRVLNRFTFGVPLYRRVWSGRRRRGARRLGLLFSRRPFFRSRAAPAPVPAIEVITL